MQIQGTFTALITPFRDGSIDVEGLKHNIYFQKEEGVSGFLVLGSTGEKELLSRDEQLLVMKTVVEEADGAPVVVAITACSTKEMIERAKEAAAHGATAVLVAPPPYVLPNDEGLYKHFCMVGDIEELPVILYQAPKRTGVRLSTDLICELATHPNIIGLKDSGGIFSEAAELVGRTKEKPFNIYIGDDVAVLGWGSLGVKGLFSVAANLIPGRMAKLMTHIQDGQLELAREAYFELLPLFEALSLDTNPIPIKAAMKLCGMAAGAPRLPLTELDGATCVQLNDALQHVVRI